MSKNVDKIKKTFKNVQ